MGILTDVLTNPKTATSTSLATTTTGVATWLDWIPNDIGKLATLIGMVLSTVLIVYWARKIRSEHISDKLKHEQMRLEIERMRQNNAP